MSNFAIAGIGELLWDVLQDSEALGGAPMNFAYHAGALGAKGYPVSTIGDDRRGKDALRLLQERGVPCDHITVLPGGVTGYVLAEVDAAGIATYRFPENVAWDNLSLSAKTLELAASLNAVCFGSLGQRSPHSRRVIQDYLHRLPTDALKVFDINIRQNFYSRELLSHSMEIADVVKLNDDELELIASLENLTGDVLAQLRTLIARYGLQLVVLTRGDKGSLLVTPTEVSDHRGRAARVVDTIGAGDSFTAATVVGLLKGMPLDAINEHANRVAAYVCSQQGAMARLPAELRLVA